MKMIETQVSWDAGFKNPSGPRLRFVKFEESSGADGHLTRYRVYAEGAQEGTPYILAFLKIGMLPENVQILSNGAYVNRKGLLLTRRPARDEEDSQSVGGNAEFDLGLQAANGEPVRFLLRSKDNKVMIPGTLVPFPIESAENGCKLSAFLSAPEANIVLFYADGFPPNSEVVAEGNSAGELKEGRHMTDGRGHARFIALPFVLGKDNGVLKESIRTKDCSVTVEVPWGKGSYRKH